MQEHFSPWHMFSGAIGDRDLSLKPSDSHKLFRPPHPGAGRLQMYGGIQMNADILWCPKDSGRYEVLRVTFELYALRVYAGPCSQELVGALRTARAWVLSDAFMY